MTYFSSLRAGSLARTLPTCVLCGCAAFALACGAVQAKEKHGSAPAVAVVPDTLAGEWHGSFKRQEGDASRETEYTVNVGEGTDSIEVVAVNGTGVNTEIEVVTHGPLKAVYKDGIITLSAQETQKQGGATMTIDRLYTLQFGRDQKHALFTYTVETVTADAKGSRHVSLKGEGVLTRNSVRKTVRVER